MADQEHHADKVEYAHEHARHVQELKKNPLQTVERLTLSWLRMIQLSLGKPCTELRNVTDMAHKSIRVNILEGLVKSVENQAVL